MRALLALRALEVALVATVPTLATRHRLYGADYLVTDAVALAALVVLCGCLAVAVWHSLP